MVQNRLPLVMRISYEGPAGSLGYVYLNGLLIE